MTDSEVLISLCWALDIDPQTLLRIGHVSPRCFTEARQSLMDALRAWDEDYTVPACLCCGSPRVDWVQETALYRCHDCGAEEDRAGKARKAV